MGLYDSKLDCHQFLVIMTYLPNQIISGGKYWGSLSCLGYYEDAVCQADFCTSLPETACLVLTHSQTEAVTAAREAGQMEDIQSDAITVKNARASSQTTNRGKLSSCQLC